MRGAGAGMESRKDMLRDSTMRQNFMAGLQGGELQDRVFTSSLTGGGGGGGYNNYGLSSSCQEGVNQNTALLATASAIAVGAGVIFRAVTLQ